MLVHSIDLAATFSAGRTYHDLLSEYGTDEHRRRWQQVYEQISLTSRQRELLASFRREMHVICLAGAWCGDCVSQCPIFERFAAESPAVQVRYFDRDANPELARSLSICGGARVPAVLFLSEDDQQVGFYGDRTLARYRQVAAEQAGASCPTGLATPADQLAAVVQDWLNEFERVQLLLRTSSRLRQKHGD